MCTQPNVQATEAAPVPPPVDRTVEDKARRTASQPAAKPAQRSTLLTSPLGAKDTPVTQRKTLLGQ